MPQPNAIQQVFNPATQRTLIRIGLFLAVGLAVTLIVVFVIRMVKKSAASGSTDKGNGSNSGNGNGSNLDGTPNLDEQDRFNDLGLLLRYSGTGVPEIIHFIRWQLPFLP